MSIDVIHLMRFTVGAGISWNWVSRVGRSKPVTITVLVQRLAAGWDR